MEIIKGWRVVRTVKTDAGHDKQEMLSRVFHVREAALNCAVWCGDGAYVEAVKKYVVSEMKSLC